MTYYGGEELAEAFRTVRKNTLKIAEEIPEDKYGFRAAEGTRTVAELLTHIANADRFHQAITLAGKNSLEGFNFQEFMAGMMAEMSKRWAYTITTGIVWPSIQVFFPVAI